MGNLGYRHINKIDNSELGCVDVTASVSEDVYLDANSMVCNYAKIKTNGLGLGSSISNCIISGRVLLEGGGSCKNSLIVNGHYISSEEVKILRGYIENSHIAPKDDNTSIIIKNSMINQSLIREAKNSNNENYEMVAEGRVTKNELDGIYYRTLEDLKKAGLDFDYEKGIKINGDLTVISPWNKNEDLRITLGHSDSYLNPLDRCMFNLRSSEVLSIQAANGGYERWDTSNPYHNRNLWNFKLLDIVNLQQDPKKQPQFVSIDELPKRNGQKAYVVKVKMAKPVKGSSTNTPSANPSKFNNREIITLFMTSKLATANQYANAFNALVGMCHMLKN